MSTAEIQPEHHTAAAPDPTSCSIEATLDLVGDRWTLLILRDIFRGVHRFSQLRDDLGIIESSTHSHEVAQQCTSSDGVAYVPALLGLGTPDWDYGARGTLLGLTRGTNRSHIVRAVLDGVANRCADLVEAATADTGVAIDGIRLDGGMSVNPTLVAALADSTGCCVEVSPTTEATTRGAAFLAGLALGR